MKDKDTLTTETSLDTMGSLIGSAPLTRAESVTPISPIPSISLSIIQKVPPISLSSEQDPGNITAGELFEQFHIISPGKDELPYDLTEKMKDFELKLTGTVNEETS